MAKEALRLIPGEDSMSARRENLREQFFIWVSRGVITTVTPGAVGGAIFLASKGDVSYAMLVGSGAVFVDMTALSVHWALDNIVKREPRINKEKT